MKETMKTGVYFRNESSIRLYAENIKDESLYEFTGEFFVAGDGDSYGVKEVKNNRDKILQYLLEHGESDRDNIRLGALHIGCEEFQKEIDALIRDGIVKEDFDKDTIKLIQT